MLDFCPGNSNQCVQSSSEQNYNTDYSHRQTEVSQPQSSLTNSDIQSNASLLQRYPQGILDVTNMDEFDDIDGNLSENITDMDNVGLTKLVSNCSPAVPPSGILSYQQQDMYLVFRTSSVDCISDTVCVKRVTARSIMRRWEREVVPMEGDNIDHMFEMNGFVTDMCFSPDRR